MKWIRVVVAISLAAPTTPALAAETITYSYDALGRLTGVSHSGTINSGLQSSYSYDTADNRSNVTVTGATGGAGKVIVVPLGGLMVIPISANQ